MKISSGLIIRPEPLEKILSGRKKWEMRSARTQKRETVALIKKGSKAIFGVADIVDSKGPLSREEMLANISLHLIGPDRIDTPEVSKWRCPWVLENVRRLKTPIPYIHKGGVTFVNLDDEALAKLTQTLAEL